ncbi:lipoprotein, tandem type [Leptospira kirschneri]|uniref:lipoprotein, tandem type n=1 Tax=Leptospira kirschneri TaxID=29507 RepID=UPI0002FEEAC3|nr:lipoprotein, tandem type [Leptospira kirschneri]
MKLNQRYLILLSIVAICLTGCKKSPEELAKEEEAKKLKLISENINSVYAIPGNGIAYLVDSEKVKEFRDTCFEFKPKEGKASVKFYQHPAIYNLEVKAKNELEYILIYQGKQADLKLDLEGRLPKEDSDTVDVLSASVHLIVIGDSASKGMGNINLVYDGFGQQHLDAGHGRFNSLEECEERYARDEEIGKQKSTCEGPGC